MFSKACEYGIRAMIHIHLESARGMRPSLKTISAGIESPEAFTAKILQNLSRKQLLISTKGPSGGFVIGKDDITLADIVKAIDGDGIFTLCGLGLKQCSESKPCPVHHKFKKIRNELVDMLGKTTLTDMSEKLSSGKTYLAV
jgi:Rrf2 family protein